MARLRWNGSAEAQRLADDAYAKLKPKKKRRKKKPLRKRRSSQVDSLTAEFIELVRGF